MYNMVKKDVIGMKKVFILFILLITLSACSFMKDAKTVDDVKTKVEEASTENKEIPQPGDPDFIGPLTKEQWEEANNK